MTILKLCAIPGCGVMFEAYHPKQDLYCSKRCKNAAYWRRAHDRTAKRKGRQTPALLADSMDYVPYIKALLEARYD